MSGSQEHSREDAINIKYIYDLPYDRRKKLCNLLDLNDEWKELGGTHIKFDCYTLNKISKAVYRRESPTEELLQLWGNQNHTILELFILLKRMKHFQAMKELQPFVDKRYHRLIYEGISQIEIQSSDIDELNTILEFPDAIANNSDLNEKTRRQKQESNSPSQGTQRNSTKLAHNKSNSSNLNDLESSIPFINYKELEAATNKWDQSNILGRGGFGVVFKGIWKQTAVAIKRLEPQKGNEIEFNALEAQRQQSFRELKYLNSSRHDNILPLYGYSVGEDKYCLIYQYMPNGSLEDRIQCRHGTAPLPWPVRSRIVTGAARGLQFLHGVDKPLIHGDIKSANILIDSHYEAKIGDFGLAREGPTDQYTHVKVSRVHGTRPYLPDEFLRGKKFSPKVDTYSFGVVLFEIATGLRAYDDGRPEKFLRDYVYNYNEDKIQELSDPKAGCENFNFFKVFIELGKKCVSQRAKDRPEMIDVSKQLDSILAERDTIYRAINNLRLTGSATPNPFITGRKQSLIPATGSYHPEYWLFATPPASIQPPSVRRSPSPSNPAVSGMGLELVTEERPDISSFSSSNDVSKSSLTDTVAPNFSTGHGIPDIVLIPPNPSILPHKSLQLGTKSSTLSSIESISVDISAENQNDPKQESNNQIDQSQNPENLSDAPLPMVTMLQN